MARRERPVPRQPGHDMRELGIDGPGKTAPHLAPAIPLEGRGQAVANLRTSTGARLCCACQRSYCIYWASQLSGLPPKALDKRIVISGEMPGRPLSSIDRVLRETERPFAASVTVSPRGSRHWRRMSAPGWGGCYMSMGMTSRWWPG